MAKVTSNLVEDMEHCMVCGVPGAENHHIFFGYKRKKCDKYKLTVPLCGAHHRGNEGPHMNRKVDLAYKAMAQRYFEKNIGTRDFFRQEFGKSYL